MKIQHRQKSINQSILKKRKEKKKSQELSKVAKIWEDKHSPNFQTHNSKFWLLITDDNDLPYGHTGVILEVGQFHKPKFFRICNWMGVGWYLRHSGLDNIYQLYGYIKAPNDIYNLVIVLKLFSKQKL